MASFIKMYHCVGCGLKINWDGKGLFSYTCPCRCTVFASDDGLALPASVGIQIGTGRPLTHLEFIIGTSEFTSFEKEHLVTWLRSKGFISIEECPHCLIDGTLERYRRRREFDTALSQIKVKIGLGELTVAEATKEREAVYERFRQK